MSTPRQMSDAELAERVRQDGEDRRFAASVAIREASILTGWEENANEIYTWLRMRASTTPASLQVTAGQPQQEGTPP